MRTYTCPLTGAELPSVTSIIDTTMSDVDRMVLARWYADKPNSHFQNVESQRRGNAVDSWAKAYLLSTALPEIDWQFYPYCEQLIPHLDRLRGSAHIVVDQILYSERYAGTLDAAVSNNGTSWQIIEFKSKRNISPASVTAAKLQAVAYKEAFLLPVDGIEIIIATPKKSELIAIADTNELRALSLAWRERLAQFYGGEYATLP